MHPDFLPKRYLTMHMLEFHNPFIEKFISFLNDVLMYNFALCHVGVELPVENSVTSL